MSDDDLSLRSMKFEGFTLADDWLVIWRGQPVGRILKRSDVASGEPDWYWRVEFEQRQTDDMRGVERDFDSCKARFREAWQRLRAGLG